MSDDVSLTVNRSTVAGWTSVRITRGMERIPSDFDISMTERFPDTTTVALVRL
ncbi:phage baseplate assembly protein [Paraburkholderia sp. DGU8]|jgi:prophage tail gpP-like protein|uniref:phage baseplate assembly protein n=1 Tax=Paraburkholderia sp. DGU8 TaxID=3161997 RepID=UPI003466A05F